MIHVLAFLDRNAGIIIAALCALLALAILTGCGDAPPPRTGSAQAGAAGAQARAAAAATRADQAGAESARLAGEAAAAEAKAKASGIAADIDAAVAARVAAIAAGAVHIALLEQERAAAAQAAAATTAAQAEHAAELAAQDYRSWMRLCRIIGLAGIVGGVLAGGIVGWLTKSPRTGLGICLLLSGAGAATIAIGPATAWLPWLVGAAAVLAILWWALGHHFDRRAKDTAQAAAIAGSRAVDAVEREIAPKARDAKQALANRLAAAGLTAHVEARRGPSRDWSTP